MNPYRAFKAAKVAVDPPALPKPDSPKERGTWAASRHETRWPQRGFLRGAAPSAGPKP